MDKKERIDNESDEIAHIIRRFSLHDDDSRKKILSTVASYYELGENADDELSPRVKAMKEINESMSRAFEDAQPLRGAIPRYSDPDEIELRQLVDRFSEAMLKKLLAKKREGYHGWNDTSVQGLEKDFWEKMNEHTGRWRSNPRDTSNIIDTANFLAFIWNLRVK